jgi:hypothetical protein
MISLLAAKATLRVIGLATVMQGNPGIDVVMPQVPNTEATHVEEHVAVLIVRDDELVVGSTEGWTTGRYRDRDGFTFVVLTGEDIQFLPDARNPVARVPSQLPRLTNGCRWIVPPVGPVAAAGGSPAIDADRPTDEIPPRPPLLFTYRPPLYEAAAAVLRVPYGSTKACRAFVQKEVKRDRIDTNVVWSTGGGVTIVGKHHRRRLRLEGDEVLIVAGNVPKSLLLPEEPHLVDTGHFKVYYTMLNPMGQQGCVRQEPAGIQRCPESTKAIRAAPPRPVPEFLPVFTSECSNTQYP